MRQTGLILALLVGLPAQAANLETDGAFTGTGRSCHGSLAVTPQAISWLTPFSQCKSVPVQLLERQDERGRLRMVYRLKHKPRQCHYRIVMLQHELNANEDGAWSVIGYGSVQSYESDRRSGYTSNTPDMMACPLTHQTQ